MVNALHYLGGRYVKAVQLPTERHVVAVIVAVTEETMEGSNEQKLVLALRSTTGRAWPKRMVPNVTNRKILIEAFGAETDGWVGQSIEAWAAPVQFGAETVLGIKLLALNGRGAAKPALEAKPVTPPISHREQINQEVPLDCETGGGDLDDEIPFGPCVQ